MADSSSLPTSHFIRIRFDSCARPERGMGVPPMQHRRDADATKSDAHELFLIRITRETPGSDWLCFFTAILRTFLS